jgi:hypothetical protein
MVKLSVNFKLIGLVVLVKIVNRSFLFLIFQVYHFGMEKLASIFSDSSSKVCPAVIRLVMVNKVQTPNRQLSHEIASCRRERAKLVVMTTAPKVNGTMRFFIRSNALSLNL